jgi:hypothetical protein
VWLLRSGQRKISQGRNFWGINSDCLLDGMAHDNPILQFFRSWVQKTCLACDLALLQAHCLKTSQL